MTLLSIDFLVWPSFIGGLIGMGFLLYSLRINKNANGIFIRIGAPLVIQLFFIVIIAIIADSVDKADARERVRLFSNRPDLRITVNGLSPDSMITNELLAALKGISDTPAHHSSPTDGMFVQLISAKDSLLVYLRQDSYYATEYWVYPDQNASSEIGRIHTTKNFKNR